MSVAFVTNTKIMIYIIIVSSLAANDNKEKEIFKNIEYIRII